MIFMNTLVDGAMVHEQEILQLYDYMDRYYRLPDPYDRNASFDKASYGRWAIEEVIQMLVDNPTYDVDQLVCEFAITMRALAARRTSVSFIFEIAADTAEEIREKILY